MPAGCRYPPAVPDTPARTIKGRLQTLAGRVAGIRRLAARVDHLERELREVDLRLQRKIEDLESRLLESQDALRQRSKRRWAASPPDANLTWGRALTGEAFVEQALRHFTPSEDSAILELGPGYGRLLQAFLSRGLPFRSYLAVDLSPLVLDHLRERFPDPRIAFVQGDLEDLPAGDAVDLAWSALTFKHLFPSIERALEGLAHRLAPGGVAIFDLREGEERYFEDDGVTFVRAYRRDELPELVRQAGLELEAIDTVRHDPQSPESERLLVVARRPRK